MKSIKAKKKIKKSAQFSLYYLFMYVCVFIL